MCRHIYTLLLCTVQNMKPKSTQSNHTYLHVGLFASVRSSLGPVGPDPAPLGPPTGAAHGAGGSGAGACNRQDQTEPEESLEGT